MVFRNSGSAGFRPGDESQGADKIQEPHPNESAEILSKLFSGSSGNFGEVMEPDCRSCIFSAGKPGTRPPDGDHPDIPSWLCQ